MDKRPSSVPLTWMYIAVLLIALSMFGVGVYLATTHQGWSLLAAGCVSLVAVLVTWPIAAAVWDFRASAVKREDELVTVLTDRLQQISVLLNLISEQQLLSDRAKSVAFREKDRDALRRAIQEEIARHDFEAALALAADMEEIFGYRQEVERYREEIQARRQELVARQINDAVAVIDNHIREEAWDLAFREGERIAVTLPDNPVAQKIPQEVQLRREAHKKRLRESWDEAVARNDIDGSIQILKKLDAYLSPAEADGMKETARNIFKLKLQNLGNQFTAAYQDHNNAEAARIAEEIMRDYPNTRMAQEVKEKLDALRARPAAPAATPA